MTARTLWLAIAFIIPAACNSSSTSSVAASGKADDLSSEASYCASGDPQEVSALYTAIGDAQARTELEPWLEGQEAINYYDIPGYKLFECTETASYEVWNLENERIRYEALAELLEEDSSFADDLRRRMGEKLKDRFPEISEGF
jgi:hypothetical protein